VGLAIFDFFNNIDPYRTSAVHQRSCDRGLTPAHLDDELKSLVIDDGGECIPPLPFSAWCSAGLFA
jgi:hypothetical protein